MAIARYVDDNTIPNQAKLLRRIPPCFFIRDENLGRMRPSSAAFDDHPDGSPMSVVLADGVREAGRTPDSVLVGYTDYALAMITAGTARECHQNIVRDPTPEEPAHAVVFGRKTKAVKRKFALEARWAIPPHGA